MSGLLALKLALARSADVPADCAAALKAWRADMGLTQRDAAHVLGIKERTLQGWEMGRRAVLWPAMWRLLCLMSIAIKAE